MTKGEDKNTGCAYGKVTRAKLESLEAMFERFINNDFKELKQDMKCVKDKISNPRPSWGITFALTALCSLCTGLIIILFRTIGRIG